MSMFDDGYDVSQRYRAHRATRRVRRAMSHRAPAHSRRLAAALLLLVAAGAVLSTLDQAGAPATAARIADAPRQLEPARPEPPFVQQLPQLPTTRPDRPSRSQPRIVWPQPSTQLPAPLTPGTPAAPTVAPSLSPSPSPSPTAAPTPSPSQTPGPSSTPTPSPTAEATPTPSSSPTSKRGPKPPKSSPTSSPEVSP